MKPKQDWEKMEERSTKVSLKLKCDDGWVGWEVGVGGGREEGVGGRVVYSVKEPKDKEC